MFYDWGVSGDGEEEEIEVVCCIGVANAEAAIKTASGNADGNNMMLTVNQKIVIN